jgi:type I restriction enzyme S subunit
MANWRRVKLAECVDLLAGFPFKSQHFTDRSDDIPLVKGENVSQGRILWDISKRWPSAELEAMAKFQLLPGDVVVAMDRPWVPAGLKWAFIRDGDPKALLVQRCARLRSKGQCLDQTFLRFVIGGPDFENYVKPITTGVNVPHISGRQILDFAFTLPPLSEQRRIARILSAYDDLIENNQRRIQIFEQMARALYREWFVEFRFPGHEKVRLVKSPIGPIPEGWQVKKLDAVCELTMGQSPRSEYYNETGEGVPFHQGVTDFGDRFPTDRLFCTANGRMARAGDILFSVRAPVGRMNLADKDLMLGRGLSSIRHRDGHQAFLWEQLRNRFTKEDMIGNGAIFAAVTKADMQNIEVLCPLTSLVEAASRHLNALNTQIETLTKQARNLRHTRDLLLPRLLSGQITLGGTAAA